jgi:sRNA-binding protein
MTAETRAAASLELSSEAQRLALIPAQVMDTDEIAEARKQVTEAQAKVAEAMAAQRAAGQEAQAPPAATSAPQESSPQVQRAAATQATLAHASHQADMTEAVVEMQQTAQTRELNLEPQPEATTSEPRSRTAAEASPQTAPPVMDRPSEPSPASEGRPDAMSALQGRSPFESSTPGSTGQSIDIVVGEDG